MEIWKDAWRSIFRRPSRSLLTICSIGIGIFSVVVIGIIGETGKQAVTAELSSLGMEGVTLQTEEGVSAILTRQELEAVRRDPQVQSATPLVVNYGEAESTMGKENAVIWGVDANIPAMVSLELLYGRSILPADVSGAEKVCMVEEALALELFGRSNVTGRTVSLCLEGTWEDFKIIGVAETGGSIFQSMMGGTVPPFVYLPYTAQQQCSGQQGFDRIAVQFRSGAGEEAGAAACAAAEASLGESGTVRVEKLSQFTDTFTGVVDLVTLILSGIAGISLIVAGLSIMTAMLSSVRERTREIGIKKSLGASSGVIVAEFLLESVFLSLAGSAAGILIGTAGCWAAGTILGTGISIQPELIWLCLGSALLTGAVFGAYPAKRAAELRPVEALRQ